MKDLARLGAILQAGHGGLPEFHPISRQQRPVALEKTAALVGGIRKVCPAWGPPPTNLREFPILEFPFPHRATPWILFLGLPGAQCQIVMGTCTASSCSGATRCLSTDTHMSPPPQESGGAAHWLEQGGGSWGSVRNGPLLSCARLLLQGVIPHKYLGML